MESRADDQALATLSAIIDELALQIDEGLSRPVQTWSDWLNGEGYDTNGLGSFLADAVKGTEASLIQLKNDYDSACQAEATTANFLEILNTKAPAFIAAVNERVLMWRENQQQIETTSGGKSIWSNTRISGNPAKEAGADAGIVLGVGAVVGVSFLVYRAINKTKKEASGLIQREVEKPRNEEAFVDHEEHQISSLDLQPRRTIERDRMRADELRTAQIEANAEKLVDKLSPIDRLSLEPSDFHQDAKSLLKFASEDVIRGEVNKLNKLFDEQLKELYIKYPSQSKIFETQTLRMARNWTGEEANKFEDDFKWADKATKDIEKTMNDVLKNGNLFPSSWDPSLSAIQERAKVALRQIGLNPDLRDSQMVNFFKIDNGKVVIRDDERFLRMLGKSEEKGANYVLDRLQQMDDITAYLEAFNKYFKKVYGEGLDKNARIKLQNALKLLLSDEKSEVAPVARALVNSELANAEVQLEKDTIDRLVANAKKESMESIQEVEESLEEDIKEGIKEEIADEEKIKSDIGSIVDDI